MPQILETMPIEVELGFKTISEASISMSPSEFRLEPIPALTKEESSTLFINSKRESRGSY